MNETVSIIAGGIYLLICAICAFKENKIVGSYKFLGVFGRFKAYMALACTFGGLAAMVTGFIPIFTGKLDLVAGLIGLICLCVGFLIYFLTYHKCPVFLQHRCILDMIIVALGISMKIALFFIAAVWAWQAPRAIDTTDGGQIYVFHDGTAYDPRTGWYGTYDPYDHSATFRP